MQFDRLWFICRRLRETGKITQREYIEKFERGEKALDRDLRTLRNYCEYPIVYDRARGAYYLQRQEDGFELPGFWFTGRELYAVLAIYQLLHQVEPGLLHEVIAPFRKRIEALISSEFGCGDQCDRIRILDHKPRSVDSDAFQVVAEAVLSRYRLALNFYSKGSDTLSQREVSPQRLVYYRHNWYLDAWCHLRCAMRTFSLDGIRKARLLKDKAEEVATEELNAYFGTSYGIFAGAPTQTAKLRFSPNRARWVAQERWHPDQNGYFDGEAYILEIPYSDDRELIMDILSHGPDVEVLGPEGLREKIVDLHKHAIKRYGFN